MPAWTLTALAALAACSTEITTPDLGDDLDDPSTVKCDVDPSSGFTSAYEGTLGATLADTFCPKKDKDYWVISAGGAGQLLEVSLSYDKLSQIELAAEVFFGQGEHLGRVIEKPVSGAVHRLRAHFPAFTAGDYYVLVYDHAEQEASDSFQYSLTVSSVSDPDTFEPNDTSDTAATLTSGQQVSGSMSYVDDVDWYRITPGTSSPAVVKIDLTWPATATMAPTWTLRQGSWEQASGRETLEGAGATAVRARRAALVTPGNEEIFIGVTNSGATAIDEAYTLRVEIVADGSEGNDRNDSAATATEVNLPTPGAPGAGGSVALDSGSATLIAQNDVDWYRFDRGAVGENSLVYAKLTAAADAPYVLLAQLFRPSSQTCSDTSPCAQGRPCSAEGRCLELWVQRPSPDGPGDPQVGGLKTNHLETQLPLYDSGDGVLYLRVAHTASTTLAVPGFDFESASPYALRIEHRDEPDAGDETNPDNAFVARPLAPGVGRGSFAPQPRVVTPTEGIDGGTGLPFASVMGAEITGYISYDGDQDFFTVPLTSIGKSGLTIYVDYPASSVELRVSVARNGSGASAGASSENNDICPEVNCAGPGSCDERNQCTQPALYEEVGPLASSPSCVYLPSITGDVQIWVNDVNANDWDTLNPYTVRFEMHEGCPALCSEYVCSQ